MQTVTSTPESLLEDVLVHGAARLPMTGRSLVLLRSRSKGGEFRVIVQTDDGTSWACGHVDRAYIAEVAARWSFLDPRREPFARRMRPAEVPACLRAGG